MQKPENSIVARFSLIDVILPITILRNNLYLYRTPSLIPPILPRLFVARLALSWKDTPAVSLVAFPPQLASNLLRGELDEAAG